MKITYILAGIAALTVSGAVGFAASQSQSFPPEHSVKLGAATPENFAHLAPVAVETVYLKIENSSGGAKSNKHIWVSDDSYADLIVALEGLSTHGLDPSHYHLEKLKLLQDDRGERDQWATDAWHSAAAHLIYGKIDPITVEPDWTAARRQVDISKLMQDALVSGTVTDSLSNLAPKQPEYRVLRAELARLRELEEMPILAISSGESLKKGMSGTRVQSLQDRLVQLSLLSPDSASGLFNAETLSAVKLFQFQSDLDDDGVAGSATINALNLGLQGRIDQVRVNLERARWLPDDLGKKHVRVNIAGFKATAWQNGALERTHLAIVGKPFRKTPVFSDEIEYLIFNPWWETPASLARADKLPAFRRDPGAVKRLGFQVLDRSGNQIDSSTIDWNSVSASNFPYRLRQAPGEQNALGQVKIMFPNTHNVYLHDTPTRGLFAKRQRAFSSGCIRTQDPLDLSAWLLSESPGWDEETIRKTVKSGKETRATLKTKIPVHVLYNTVIADPNGEIRYLDDIYGRDNAVLEGLDAEPARAI